MVADAGNADRTAWVTAFALIGLSVGTALLFYDQLSDVLGPLPWFLRTYAAIIGPCELAAALLLAWRAVALRTRRAALLAAAYAWSTPLVWENLASLPGILGLQHVFAHQTPPWCWLAWHAGWALYILAFAWVPDRPVRRPLAIVVTALALSLVFGFVALHADVWLPPALGPGDGNTPLLLVIGWTTVMLFALAGIGIAVARAEPIDAFVLVAIVALALDEGFVLTTAVRFSLGTYLARALGAINAVIVLCAFAVEFGTLLRTAPGSLRERAGHAAAVRREATLRHVAATIPQLVWIAAPDGRVEWFNQRWFDYTGQSAAAASSLGWTAVLHPEDAAFEQHWRDALAAGTAFTDEPRLRAADGSYRRFVTRFEPMHDGRHRIVKWYGSATAR